MRMSPLEARKRLLIAESELNRARMAIELTNLGSGVATFVASASHIETLLSSLAGVLGFGRAEAPPAAKPAVLGTVIAVCTTLWQVFRRRN
jgi:hypothetical protein